MIINQAAIYFWSGELTNGYSLCIPNQQQALDIFIQACKLEAMVHPLFDFSNCWINISQVDMETGELMAVEKIMFNRYNLKKSQQAIAEIKRIIG